MPFPENIHPYTLRWWESLPQAYRKYDVKLGYPLLRYMEGAGGTAGVIEDVSLDMFDGTIMDPATTPDGALRWLAMLLGLPAGQRAARNPELRQILMSLVENGRPPVGTRQGVAEAVKQFLVGDKQVFVVPTPGKPYVLTVLVRLDEVPGAGGSGPQYPYSSRVLHTNYVLDPSFESGATTGWTKPTGSSLKSITSVAGAGVNGGRAVRLLGAGTMSTGQANVAMFELPDTLIPGVVTAKVRCDTPVDSQFTVYASIQHYEADGTTFIGEVSYSNQYVGMNSGWKTFYLFPHYTTAFNPPGGKRYLKLQAGDPEYTQPHLENAEIFVDQVSLTDAQIYFDGDTSPVGEYSYEWTAAQYASPSNMLTSKQVSAPSEITMGTDYPVFGKGFAPGSTVTMEDRWWNVGTTTATVDGAGNFQLTLNIPAGSGPDLGPDNEVIVKTSVSGDQDLYLPVTYL